MKKRRYEKKNFEIQQEKRVLGVFGNADQPMFLKDSNFFC
jgi:hypothetical protein